MPHALDVLASRSVRDTITQIGSSVRVARPSRAVSLALRERG
jgi:hypothetical protein